MRSATSAAAVVLICGCTGSPTRPPQPDAGRTRVTATAQRTPRPWRLVETAPPAGAAAETGEPTKVDQLALSRDGRVLVVSSNDRLLRVYRLAPRAGGGWSRPQLPHIFTRGILPAIALTRDGRRLARATTPITVVDLDRGDPPHQLRRRKRLPLSLAFSDDGRWLASATRAREITLWRMQDGKALRTMEVKTAKAKQLAARCKAGANARSTRQLECSGAAQLAALAFSCDGQRLYSTSADEIVRWRVESGEQLEVVERIDEPTGGACGTRGGFAPATLPAAARQADVRAYAQTIIAAARGRRIWIFARAMPPRGQAPSYRLAGELVLWTEPQTQKPQRDTDDLDRLTFSPDGSVLQTRTWRGVVRLWDTRRRVLTRELGNLGQQGQRPPYPWPLETLSVTAEAVRPPTVEQPIWTTALDAYASLTSDGSTCNGDDCDLPYADGDKRVHMWPATGAWATVSDLGLSVSTAPALIKGRFAGLVAFCADGAIVAAADARHVVTFCTVATGRCQRPLRGLRHEAKLAAATSDGSVVAAASDREVIFARREAQPTRHRLDRVHAIALSRDGLTLAVAVDGGRFQLYHPARRGPVVK